MEYENDVMWMWVDNGYTYSYEAGGIDKEEYIETEWNKMLMYNMGYTIVDDETHDELAYSFINSQGNYIAIIKDLVASEGECEGIIE